MNRSLAARDVVRSHVAHRTIGPEEFRAAVDCLMFVKRTEGPPASMQDLDAAAVYATRCRGGSRDSALCAFVEYAERLVGPPPDVVRDMAAYVLSTHRNVPARPRHTA